jgi:DNA polymerase III sliding clamp (beta) subunit (PCNA family)
MITVLATNAYKAAYKVRKAATPAKTLPVSYCMLVQVHDNHLVLTPFRFDERVEHAEAVQARVMDDEWATCVPAKPFTDWLYVTQNKGKTTPDQIELSLDETTQTLHIRAGNTRAEFKCIDAREFPTA